MYSRSKSRPTWYVTHPEQPVGEQAAVYLFPSGVYAVPYSGDITKATADAVVTEEPADLSPTNFVSRALLWKSGEDYRLDRRDLIKSYGALKYGQVYETRAGTGLNFFYTFHAIVTSFQEGREKEWMKCTHDLYRNILKRADEKLATTIAMPLIGTGSAAAPTHYAIDAFIQCMANISPQFLKKIFIICIDPNVTDKIRQACINFVHQISYRAMMNQTATTNRIGKLQSSRIADANDEDVDASSLGGPATFKSGRRGKERKVSLKNGTDSEGSKARVTFRDDVQSPDSDWSRPLRTLREKRLARSYNGSEFHAVTDTHVNDRFKEIPFNAVESALEGSQIVKQSEIENRVQNQKVNKSLDIANDNQPRPKSKFEIPHKTENTKNEDVAKHSNKPSDTAVLDTPDHEWDDPESDDNSTRPTSRSRRHKAVTSTSRSNTSGHSSGRSNKLRSSGSFSETLLENPERYVDVDAWYRSKAHRSPATTKETKSGPSRSIRLKPTRHSHGKINLRGFDLTDRSRWETMQPKARQRRRSLMERHVWLKEAVIVDTARDSDEWNSVSDSGNETDDEVT